MRSVFDLPALVRLSGLAGRVLILLGGAASAFARKRRPARTARRIAAAAGTFIPVSI